MKVAVIGATGQLGSDLVKVLKNTEDAVPLTRENIDITDYRLSERVLRDIEPEVVINSAAYVRVDDAEDFPEEAFRVNALGARNIALICRELDSVLVHISTDYVFDGRKNVYNEEDIPNPLNVYGNSKLAGEYFVRNILDRHYIIRVSSLFGVAGSSGKGGNFVETMINKANSREIKVVEDIVMSPTYTRDAADIIINIITKKLPFGIYHVANKGKCSWYEFARTIFEMLGMKVSLFPVKSSMIPYKAKRPCSSPLESIKLRKYGLEMQSWENALKDYLVEKGYLK